MSNGFRPAWWLPGPHAQTVWGRMARPRRMVEFQREILETPDGDELVLDHLTTGGGSSPVHVILLHGLEGSSYSVYIQGMLKLMAERGWNATAVNFRSCARHPERLELMLPNRRPRLYHSGETTDFDLVARTLTARYPQRRFAATGVSLGGNAMLKWFGEHPGQNLVEAAVSISVPYDLAAGSRYMENFAGRRYVANFLTTLRPKAYSAVERFEEAKRTIDVVGVRRAATFWDYDDAATGPLHGFQGAKDYYTRSSSLQYLGAITTPTLCISAADDPFVPPEALDRVRRGAPACLETAFTRGGGHVGFVGGSPTAPRYWAEDLAVHWIASRLS